MESSLLREKTDIDTITEGNLARNQIGFYESRNDSSNSLVPQIRNLFGNEQEERDASITTVSMRSETLGNANPGISNDLKRKASDSDVDAKHMNSEKRNKFEIFSSHEKNLQH
ncbi:hypothetical protein RRG08_001337 [Elysia crispata]|uniref:Uncharacterized protein n=1 Tax=Elysia crispata TaxID=231223 RepID=A0AAE0ZRD5_9GAST|nr:hypothetical protein RRG08_001337 [Elysia crispata]